MKEKKARQYVSENVKLMSEWDFEKNILDSPFKITLGSSKKVWWKCEKGHSWECSPNSRTTKSGTGCPYCSNHRVILGFNDLTTVRPDLAAEWHPKKNGELSPTQVSYGSNKKVWWLCQKKHEYQAKIANRNTGFGCPFCSGRYAITGTNDLQTVNPLLAQEWNYEKNDSIIPSETLPYSTKKVWWICSMGHEWQATVSSRMRGCGCPYCAGKRAIPGKNDLKTVNPTLVREWNYEKNNPLIPEHFLPNSAKKVWWRCHRGHEWQQKISHRNRGVGCPYCANSEVLIGYNDLRTTNPALAMEWNYDKNGQLSPEDFVAGSEEKVWWRCSKNHEWQATIANRNKGRGCPYCAGRKVLIGFNDLPTINPRLANEWNYNRNGNIVPENYTSTSGKKVWWRCEKGHEWQATIANRSYGNDCPVCINKKILPGFNDLRTLSPSLTLEWNRAKNKLPAEKFAPNSGKKVWWQCHKGHEWQATIASRNSGVGCPVCNSERHTSFPEFALLYYFKSCGLEVIHSYKSNGYELDIYIPSLKTAIEYDGSYWHKNKLEKDLKKNQKCAQDGIKLYRIREDLPPLNSTSIDYLIRSNRTDLQNILKIIVKEVTKTEIDIDIERDSLSIEALREYTEKANSIMVVNPTLCAEWNYEKNGALKPEYLTPNSGKRVWWKCSIGHEWQATIAYRTKGGGCPFCSGRQVIRFETDLQTLHPTLANEWIYEKNGELSPSTISPNSDKKVWWRCEKGHEWQAVIYSRTHGYGCPYCAGRYAIVGETDLQTLYPTIANDWVYEKNDGLSPRDVTPCSDKKIWWRCEKGHEWKTEVKHRTRGSGCPYCAGRKIWTGFNDLATINPVLALEWNHEKNGDLTPSGVAANSHKTVWWKCRNNHEWQARIDYRNNGGRCPECSSINRKR